MSNAHVGFTWRSRKPDLWYFDRLPPTVRAALAGAAFDWSSGWIYSQWKRGKPGLDALAAAADALHDIRFGRVAV